MSAVLHRETVAALHASVGKRRPLWPLNRRATPDAVRRFALGVGDDNPLWWDEPCSAVPPSFLYTGVNFGSWPDPGVPRAAGGQPTTTLWLEDRWTFHRSLAIGEAFGAESEIVEVVDRGADDAPTGVVLRERVRFNDEGSNPIAELLRSTVTLPRRGAVAQNKASIRAMDDALRQRILECYDAEAGRREAGRQRRWEEIAVGDSVGPMVKGPLSTTSLVGFAMGWGAPLCPTNRILHRWVHDHPESTVVNRRSGMPEGPEGIHWDPDVYGAFGFDLGFDLGPQRFSWLIHLCTDWHGDKGRLLDFEAQLLRPNKIGDVTWLSGTVTDRRIDESGRAIVKLAIEACNQDDILTSTAKATIVLPPTAVPDPSEGDAR